MSVAFSISPPNKGNAIHGNMYLRPTLLRSLDSLHRFSKRIMVALWTAYRRPTYYQPKYNYNYSYGGERYYVDVVIFHLLALTQIEI